MSDHELSRSEKSTPVAYIWWFFLGIFGAHRYYLREPLMGTLYLCTAGLAGIGWLVDLFLIPGKVRRWNDNFMDLWIDSREALEDRIEELEDQVDDLLDELDTRPPTRP